MSLLMGTVFEHNTTQVVRLPADARFPKYVKEVVVRRVGNERILSPADATWDSFFLNHTVASPDFIPERADPSQSDREPF